MAMRIKVKYHISFSIFLVLCFQAAFAQDITVLEAESNAPIAGVVIYNLKKSKSVVTDRNGKVSLAIFNANETLYVQDFLYEKFVGSTFWI